MAQHRNATPTDLIENRSYALGRLLSRVFHPILMNVLAFLIAGYYGLEDHLAGLAWAGACVLALVLPPTLFYTIRLRQGAYGDEDISIRHQRNELYLFGFVWTLLATAALIPLGVPTSLLAVIVVALALGVIGGVINLFWKISVHAAAVGDGRDGRAAAHAQPGYRAVDLRAGGGLGARAHPQPYAAPGAGRLPGCGDDGVCGVSVVWNSGLIS